MKIAGGRLDRVLIEFAKAIDLEPRDNLLDKLNTKQIPIKD